MPLRDHFWNMSILLPYDHSFHCLRIYIFYTSKYFRLKILNAKGWMELKEEVIFCVCVGVCVHKSLQNHLNG